MKRTSLFKYLAYLPFVFLLMSAGCTDVQPETKKDSVETNDVNDQEKSSTRATGVDDEAVDILRKALDYLANHDQFYVEAQSTLEDILESGHRVDYQISSNVIVDRPNKLRTERFGHDFYQVFYYNGSELSLYTPLEKVYATVQAPPTIEEMIHFVRDSFGIGAPISDLIYNNSFSLLMYSVDFAAVIGKEKINDINCDHILFSRPGVDFQVWVADSGTPLIYKYIVTDTSTPELLAFSTTMRNWNVTPSVSAETFDFEAPDDSHRITFLKVN